MKIRFASFISTALTVLVLTASACAGVITSDPNLPVLYPDGVYTNHFGNVLYNGPGLTLSITNIGHQALAPVNRSPSGPDEIEQFNSHMDGAGALNGAPLTLSLNGPVTSIVHNKIGNTTGTFQTEMLQMDISGNTLYGPVKIRESPTLASLGQTTITAIGGGLFRIDSFFDVFTELSFDGGQTWIPDAQGPCRVTLEPVSGSCVETNGVKFLLPPQNYGGFDVKDSRDNIVLADDFFCDTTGPITDIHIWGSWLQDIHGTITNFWLAIYNDVPAVTNPASGQITWSRPGTNLLWQQSFGWGQYSESIYTNGDESFYDAAINRIIGGDTHVYYYCFYPTNPFVQQGSAAVPTNYWLAIRAQIQDQDPNILYGWKTTYVPYNDPAVWGTVGGAKGLPLGDWQSMTNPQNQQSLHLSMKLTTPHEQPPPCCPETNGVKWLQRPNVINGVDVNASQNFALADDFKCTNSGPITDIHLWGSWLSDQVDPGASYTLAIWSDVPAGVDSTFSHPGSVLWTQPFGPGNYTVCPYTNVLENFYQGDGVGLMGQSTNLYYLCFYITDPANTFTQAGTVNLPTNYWLSVSVQSSTGATFPFGWKSSADTYSDAAVWAIGPLPPPTAWTPIQNPSGNPSRYDLAFKITTATNTPPPQGCIETNGTKYVQWPNLNGGLDVWDSGPWVVGDDFVCTNAGPITDLHLWGSWINDRVDPNTTFWLGLYEDVPAGPSGPSHPGDLKWEQTFGPGQYSQSLWGTGQEAFFDPGTPGITGPDSQVWYYCFYPTNPPVQQGTVTQPKVYWLLAYAQHSTLDGYQYGWKTTTNVQQDTSVFAPWPGGPPPAATPWISIQTASGVPLDLAFKITTATNTPPPQGCVETNGTKYVQWPNLFNGYDVWNSSAFPPNVTDGPWVLADDFVCTNTGPVTDIHIWGSWWYDQIASNSITFWLGIYDDVPTNAANTFSHPGNLIWQQWFAPGQYAETFWDVGQETFLDPGPSQIVGTDSKVWYYCFYPTNPPTQSGSVTAPKTYWIAAYAQLPAGANNQCYGWKTTTNVQHDVSVHAPWPGVPPVGNPGWLPTVSPFNPTSVPLDLAFKITTDTNRCPILVNCSVDKTVECGSIWGFDPPIVGPDPCCPSPPVVTFSVVTNLPGPCKEIYTGTWTITDCLGTVVTCTQTVTVVDTTPPTITCPTNKTVECGTAWTFDSPTATDACCGTNVSISIVSTITNIPNSCTQIVTRIWQATDCCANSSSCPQTVTVVDTTLPTITCPSNIVVFTCGTNIIVTWTNVASDTCSIVTVTSSPPSGSTFLPNTTNTVVATARDACGKSSSCTFTVTVRRPVLGPISIAYVSTNAVILTWTNGILQVSTNVIGPYGDVPGATPPYTNVPSLLPMKFYRLRCASP